MPTYDYLCEGCGHRFELVQKVDEKFKRTCSECGEKKLKRLIGVGGGIIYKKRQKEESGTASKESPKKEKSDGDNPSKSKSKDGSSS